MYYFQYTLNAYGKDIERKLPALEKRTGSFISLLRLLGKARVVWRYDPILLNRLYTVEWHKKNFAALAERLSGYTERCIFSFVDIYVKNKKSMDAAGRNYLRYDIKEPLLCSSSGAEDRIKLKEMRSLKDMQLKLELLG